MTNKEKFTAVLRYIQKNSRYITRLINDSSSTDPYNYTIGFTDGCAINLRYYRLYKAQHNIYIMKFSRPDFVTIDNIEFKIELEDARKFVSVFQQYYDAIHSDEINFLTKYLNII